MYLNAIFLKFSSFCNLFLDVFSYPNKHFHFNYNIKKIYKITHILDSKTKSLLLCFKSRNHIMFV